MKIYTTLNRHDFQIILSKPNISIIIHLHAKWCGPCKIIEPYLKNKLPLLKNHPQILYFDLDVDENTDISSFLKSKKQYVGIPTLLYFKDSIYSELCVSGANKHGIDEFFNTIISL